MLDLSRDHCQACLLSSWPSCSCCSWSSACLGLSVSLLCCLVQSAEVETFSDTCSCSTIGGFCSTPLGADIAFVVLNQPVEFVSLSLVPGLIWLLILVLSVGGRWFFRYPSLLFVCWCCLPLVLCSGYSALVPETAVVQRILHVEAQRPAIPLALVLSFLKP